MDSLAAGEIKFYLPRTITYLGTYSIHLSFLLSQVLHFNVECAIIQFYKFFKYSI